MNRVLTLEEAYSAKQGYLESRGSRFTLDVDLRGMDDSRYHHNCVKYTIKQKNWRPTTHYLAPMDYGVNSRIWSNRPTPDELAAWPWEQAK